MSIPATAAVRLLAGDKEPVRVASTANLALSGLVAVDGVTVEVGDRVLVKNQTDATANGIYVASEGIWYRAPDSSRDSLLVASMRIAVQEGTAHGGQIWVLMTDRPNIGDDDILFSFFLSYDTAADLAEIAEDFEEDLADLSSSILGSIISASGLAQFASRTAAAIADIPSAASYAQVLGYAVSGDGGKALYKKVVSEPSHAGKFQSADGAWWELAERVMNPLMIGAEGDGSTDDGQDLIDIIAVRSAIGGRITGLGKNYGSSLELDLPSTFIEDIELTDLSPNSANRRFIKSDGVDGIILKAPFKVHRNGSGASGGLNTAAGIWITGGSGHDIDVQVDGDNMGSGVRIEDVSDSEVRAYVHDINYLLGADPGDDRVQGIHVDASTDVDVYPRVHDIGGDFGSGQTTRWSRGVVFSGNTRCKVITPNIRNVDQGIDMTGSAGNVDCHVIGGALSDLFTFGIKFANTANGCLALGTTIDRPGFSGVIISGPAEVGLPHKGIDNRAIGCLTRNPGGNGAYLSPVGFSVAPNAFDTDFPRGSKFINCLAVDDRVVKFMRFGFRNEVVVYGGESLNECIDCESRGHIETAFDGFDFYPACAVIKSAVQSIPNGANTDVTWNSELYDGQQTHDNVTNNHLITIKRAGWYHLEAAVTWAGNVTGSRLLSIHVSGDGQLVDSVSFDVGHANEVTMKSSAWRWLNENQTVKAVAFQNSGGALDITTSGSFLRVHQALAFAGQ